MYNKKETHQFYDDVFNEKPIFKKLKLGSSPSQNNDNHYISTRSTNFMIKQKSIQENIDVCTALKSHLSVESTRKDIHGVPIIRGSKKHTVSIKFLNFEKIHLVENYKDFNCQGKEKDENSYINQITSSKEQILCKCCLIL